MNFRRIFFIIILMLIFLINSFPGEKQTMEFYNQGFPGFTGGFCYFFESGAVYAGGSFRFDLLYGIDRNRPQSSYIDRGRWEVYIDVGLFGRVIPESENFDLFFQYLVGFTTSFETPKTLKRNFLIPYIGLEFGGICIKDTGNGLMVSPTSGINLISFPGMTLSIDTSLLLSTIAFYDFLGMETTVNLNFIF